MLGLRLDYNKRQLAIRPALPAGMNRLSVRRMRLGSGEMHVEIKREADGVSYEIVSNTTGWHVVNE